MEFQVEGYNADAAHANDMAALREQLQFLLTVDLAVPLEHWFWHVFVDPSGDMHRAYRPPVTEGGPATVNFWYTSMDLEGQEWDLKDIRDHLHALRSYQVVVDPTLRIRLHLECYTTGKEFGSYDRHSPRQIDWVEYAASGHFYRHEIIAHLMSSTGLDMHRMFNDEDWLERQAYLAIVQQYCGAVAFEMCEPEDVCSYQYPAWVSPRSNVADQDVEVAETADVVEDPTSCTSDSDTDNDTDTEPDSVVPSPTWGFKSFTPEVEIDEKKFTTGGFQDAAHEWL
jgi:hypothetical protein